MSSEAPLLLCYAGDVWDGNPHSRHHLMRRFAAAGWEVLFVEGIIMRTLAGPSRAEAARVRHKLRELRLGVRTVEPRLHVLRPPPIPPSGRVGRRAQLLAVQASVRRARRDLGLRGPAVSWFSIPNVAALRGRLGESGSLLYYQDRYEAFSHVDAQWLRACLRSLAGGCEVTVATAAGLADDLRAMGADPKVIPHGVEAERFAAAAPAPADLAVAERPLVGYVGLVDDYVDLECLTAVADRLDRGTVVLVGRPNTDVEVLERHPRIRLLGRRPYEEIPGYLAAFDVCTIPFEINGLTRGVNPIKLREYLAAGRPVVSTPMPEVLPYSDVVRIADGPEAFAEAVMASLSADSDTPAARARRQERVHGESWDAVAARIEPLLRQLLPTP